MPCPFPGMDPYLERPAIWPDFHDSLIFCLREQLQPHLRPRYAALTQNRLYVVEHHRPIYPDVSVVQAERYEAVEEGGGTATAVEVQAQPTVTVEFESEQIRQPFLQIIEPAAGNRVVTAIEVLSPDNKSSGPGRDSYCQKREELIEGGANLVEIDLLRGGRSPVPAVAEHADLLGTYHSLITVTRFRPLRSRYEFYAAALTERLPLISIPLNAGDRDVKLELQDAFTRCWETGPYPALLRYDESPSGEWSEEERAWIGGRIAPQGQ